MYYGQLENREFLLIFELFFSKNNSLVGAMDRVVRQSVSQSVSEVCLVVTPIRFEVLSEPIKLQFIKGKLSDTVVSERFHSKIFDL